jgi:hypothetical protein
VLVDLPTVVAAEHDIEPWVAQRPVAPVSRHRRPFQMVSHRPRRRATEDRRSQTASVTLMEHHPVRPGATTDSPDSEQRLVDVPLQVTATNAVELQIPIEPTLAPPGWYLLFVATAAGVPSEGKWVHLS